MTFSKSINKKDAKGRTFVEADISQMQTLVDSKQIGRMFPSTVDQLTLYKEADIVTPNQKSVYDKAVIFWRIVNNCEPQ